MKTKQKNIYSVFNPFTPAFSIPCPGPEPRNLALCFISKDTENYCFATGSSFYSLLFCSLSDPDQ